MRQKSRDQGSSLVEVLIASLLFFMVVVGVLPLFIRSIQNNQMGSESTVVSHYGRGEAEDFRGLPFDDARLTITAGTESVLPREYFHPGYSGGVRAVELDSWDLLPAGAAWRRQVTVRQFSGEAPEVALPSNADPEKTTLRGIEVLVDAPGASSPWGPNPQVRYIIFKAF